MSHGAADYEGGSVADALEALGALRSHAVRRALPTLLPQDIACLRDRWAQVELACATGSFEEFMLAGLEYVRVLDDRGMNPVVHRTAAHLNEKIRRESVGVASKPPRADLLMDFRDLHVACCDGDADAAAAAVRRLYASERWR
ncbi:FCD domain-containing protein [Serinibacter salmoneus]|uniref:FCD domain-containing protein n=1 Tax=Serinibacter salmoneus TaxID=556530 RepID=A0A2A9CW13_9MICO|nr:FCD domain-containing protein [Serinibacter salmoneus]PFG18607.1 FCD domain-containing protein [Serinibacter salmoneus]